MPGQQLPGFLLLDGDGRLVTDGDGALRTVGTDPRRCCYRRGRVCSGEYDPWALTHDGEPPYANLLLAPNGTEVYELLGVCYVFDGEIEHCPVPVAPLGIEYEDCAACEANTDLEPIPCVDSEGNAIPFPDNFTLVVAGVVQRSCPLGIFTPPASTTYTVPTDITTINGAHSFTTVDTIPPPILHGGTHFAYQPGGINSRFNYEPVAGGPSPCGSPGSKWQEHQNTGTHGVFDGDPLGGTGYFLLGTNPPPGPFTHDTASVFTFQITCGDSGFWEASFNPLLAGDHFDVTDMTLEVLA